MVSEAMSPMKNYKIGYIVKILRVKTGFLDMDNCVAYGTRKHPVIQIRTAHKCYLSCAVLYIVRKSCVEWFDFMETHYRINLGVLR